MIHPTNGWCYDSRRSLAYHRPANETCTLDVIDMCSARYAADERAATACREGARDAHLFSDMGRRTALQGGQEGAYAEGFWTTSTLCGGSYALYPH